MSSVGAFSGLSSMPYASAGFGVPESPPKPSGGSCSSCGSGECSGCGPKTVAASKESSNSFRLSDEEQAQVNKLKARDAEVRAHEQAHKAVGGQYAGAISYEYQKGPDGRSYAVGGEVPIDASEVAGDPEATIEKMRIVKAAALAPAEPSGQDRKVAAMADAQMAKAQAELNTQRAEGGDPDAPDSLLQGDLNQALAEMREASPENADAEQTALGQLAPKDLAAYALGAYAATTKSVPASPL